MHQDSLKYTGTLTKMMAIPGKPNNFSEGYSVTGWFSRLPYAGESFHMLPTIGEFAGGFYYTSQVAEINSEENGLILFSTQNSHYKLTFEPLKLKVTPS